MEEQGKGVGFSFFGIRVRMDGTSWILLFLLFFWGYSAFANIGAGVVVGACLFFSLLVHERMHAFAAAHYGIGCKGITIFALGGGAHVDHTGYKPSQTFWIAAAGPLTSVFIGMPLVFLSDHLFTASLASDVLWYSGFLNVWLAIFNGLLPLFPLDGGRVVHAIAWKLSGNRVRGMRIAYRLSCGLVLFFLGFSV